MTESAGVATRVADASLFIESLDLEAQGIAHRSDGKVVFVDGALPLETVSVTTLRSKPSFDKAVVLHVERASAQRVTPACPHFGLHAGACGGCRMQHMDADAQVAVKQRALEDSLWHLGRLRPDIVLRPIHGPTWHYRYRARLSVRHVRKKGVVLVGFHERKSGFVADMRECHVLPAFVSDLLVPLRQLLGSLQARDACPQIELAVGDDGPTTVVALVLRNLVALGASDQALLHAFARSHSRQLADRADVIQWWLQPGGPDSVVLLDPDSPPLAYRLPEFGIRMPFRPTDFTQVNPQVNAVLVSQALRLLGVARHERVIDWFCGLGNFTLPLATQAAEVLGVEGSQALVERARDNALGHAQRLGAGRTLAPVQFVARNLFEMTAQDLLADGTAHKWLLDPPREGAYALVQALAQIHEALTVPGGGPSPSDDQPLALPVPDTWSMPSRIVYVSCNPATLARDAAVLVQRAGYRCAAAGVVNMFAHTAHVESIALFERTRPDLDLAGS